MEPIVAPLKIVGMAVSALISLGLPIALAILWHKRTHAKWSALLVGAITFYVFVNFLEGGMHTLYLNIIKKNTISQFLKTNL